MGLEFFDIADYVKDGGLICEPPSRDLTNPKLATEAAINEALRTYEPYEKDGKRFKTSGKMLERWHNNQAWRCWRTVLRT